MMRLTLEIVAKALFGAELGGEDLGAGIEVRLEDGDQAGGVEFAQGRKRGADLGRVMGVVVVDTDPAPLALHLEPAPDPAEVGQRRSGAIEVEPRGRKRGKRRPSVQHVMRPRYGEIKRLAVVARVD